MTPVDIQNLADVIASWPLQITVEVDHKKYLLAHAMTSAPGIEKPLTYYLMGSELNQSYLKNGIDDYISICGHRTNADHSIWKNEKENVYMNYKRRILCMRCYDVNQREIYNSAGLYN